jgi:Holliday junction DNA helicase RuvA
MIGFIRGKLVLKSPPQLLIDVQGVGYEVEAPMTTFYDLPETGVEVMLYTHLVVREDAHSLFAFGTEADRLMFRHLIRINGVGPKLALTILSGQTSDEFRRCIVDNDVDALVRLPGVGKKTAERLIIEMRDRLPDSSAVASLTAINSGRSQPQPNIGLARQEAISALSALGYKTQDATKMVQAVATDDTMSCEEIIRLALQQMVRK